MPNTASPKILIYGPGSIGGVYLYQLLQAGCTITAVCRSTFATIKKNGFQLNSVRYGNVRYKPNAVVYDCNECKDETFDFILVCTKSYPGSKPSLADQLRPVLQERPQTTVVLAQNGIGIEDEVKSAFPENPLLSGVIYLPAIQTSPGIIDYPDMLNLLELGTFPADAPRSHKQAAQRFAELMILGGGKAEIHDDIQTARWSKLLMNAAWNPISALTLTTDGDFLNSAGPYAHNMVWKTMLEVVDVARSIGVKGIDVVVAEKIFAISTKRAETGTGREMSMLQDVKHSRPLELEAIIGNVVRLGHENKIAVTRLEILYTLAKGRSFSLKKKEEESLPPSKV